MSLFTPQMPQRRKVQFAEQRYLDSCKRSFLEAAAQRVLTPFAVSGTSPFNKDQRVWGGRWRENGSSHREPGRPLAFVFEFLEIFSGASGVTEFVSGFGVVRGPPIDISISEEYNMKEPHLVAWVTHLLAEGTLKAVLLMPPCTTFSIMRRPALRDKFFPFGYDPFRSSDRGRQHPGSSVFSDWFYSSGKWGYCSAWETSFLKDEIPPIMGSSLQPCSSFFGALRFLPVWIYTQSFSFLGINVDLQPIALRCPGTCNHVQIQGAYTKASATYVPRLAYGLAHCIADGVLQIRKHAFDAAGSEGAGLESQLVNEVMLTSEWEVLKAWSFKRKATSTSWSWSPQNVCWDSGQAANIHAFLHW